MELLRQRRCTQLFHHALEVLPHHQLPHVVRLLCRREGQTAGDDSWPKPSQAMATTLLHRSVLGRQPLELDSMMQQMLDAGLRPHYRVWLAWAKLHADAGRSLGVRNVMRRVQESTAGGKVAPHYYVQLIRVSQSSVSGPQGGVALVFTLTPRLYRVHSCPPAVPALLSLSCAQAYCTQGRWQEAELLLEEMRAEGVAPSDHVYRALIWCCGRHHRAGETVRHDPCCAWLLSRCGSL